MGIQSHFEQIENISRAAIIIKRKAPFYEWVKSILPNFEHKDYMDEADVLLVPDFEEISEIETWLRKNHDDIFCWQLHAWNTDEEKWVANRNFEMFKEWFDYSMCTMVWDADQSPIEKF